MRAATAHRPAGRPDARTTRRSRVTLTDKALTVSLATNATGAITSTAAQVIAAINAHPAASALVRASKYRTQRRRRHRRCRAPCRRSATCCARRRRSSAARRTSTMLRIGNDKGKPQGEKVGVYLYCQEHGGEIATSGVCLETAERLVRNYGTDPKTTAYVDNLDIFIVPQINADGVTHSIYDSPRRTNMAPYCYDPAKYPENPTDPADRNSYGVNINRNFSVGSVFDGFQGARPRAAPAATTPARSSSPSPRPATRSGSRTRSRTSSSRTTSTRPAATSCGPPAPTRPTRETLPYPPYGTLNFFDQTASHVLDGIKSHRGTAILPAEDRPGDRRPLLGRRQQRRRGVVHARHRRLRLRDRRHPLQRHRRPARSDLRPGPAAAVRRLPPTPASPTRASTRARSSPPATTGCCSPRSTTRTTLPRRSSTRSSSADGITARTRCKFTSNEASSIYYTTDGSTPTTASTEWKPPRARALPLPLELAPGRRSSGSRRTSRATCPRSSRRCSGTSTRPAPSAAPCRRRWP